MQTRKFVWFSCFIVGVGCLFTTSRKDTPSRDTRQKVVQTVDEGQNEQLQKINGGEITQHQEATDESATSQESLPPQETKDETSGDQESSPIDAALKKLNEQEIVDSREPEVVEPREVHEALLPMVEEHWVRMHPGYEVWLDKKNNQVIVGGRISLRDGLLEMFACPMGTKEHESVIATVSNAEIVHIGLLGVGAIPGTPAYWTEETGIVTAKGPVCEITIAWHEREEEQEEEEGEEESRKEVNAKEFVIDQTTGTTLTHDWVFCGSRVWTDPDDPGYSEYQADWGDMICVSNFPTAMMDLTVESSTSNSGLLFAANPDKVPALGQPVLIFIKPDLSTNPTDEEIAAAIKAREEQEAKMAAELEARLKEREARDAAQGESSERDNKKSGSDQTEKDNSDG